MHQIVSAETAINFAVTGSGRPLVLLHGFTDGLETWTELGYAKAFGAAGFRLIMIDQRGHGRSGKPHDPAAYRAELRAGDIAAVLDALDIAQADILGYSMGGWAALNLARLHPERIDRLIVGGCHPFGQSLAALRAAVAGDIGVWVDQLERAAGPMPPARKARILANDIEALRAAVADDRPDISVALADFDRPALFFAGSDDPLCAGSARAGAHLPQGRHFAVAGCNHSTALRRAALVVPGVLEFLGA